jgi:hypothetical protein
VMVIDGDTATKQIDRLPDWVIPIFKVIFHRFREVNHKVTVLGNMKQFHQRAIKNEKIEKVVYSELFKFAQELKRTYEAILQAEGENGARSDVLYQKLEAKLADRRLDLSTFWQQMDEHEFIDRHELVQNFKVKLNNEVVNGFIQYLQDGIQTGKHLILSYNATIGLAQILERHAVGTMRGKIADLFNSDTKFPKVAVLEELKGIPAINLSSEFYEIDSFALSQIYVYQSILRNFNFDEV